MKTTLKQLQLSGAPSVKLLQRISTQDLYQCQTPKLASICNAKGKALFIFWLQFNDEQLSIFIDQTQVNPLLETLRYYDPFHQLNFHLSNHTLYSTEDFQFTEKPLRHSTPWPLFLIQQGIATLNETTQGKYTPHMLNLDQLGGICLKKGCFIGYEVIARTETRGQTKRRLQTIQTDQVPQDALNTTPYQGGYLSLVIKPVTT